MARAITAAQKERERLRYNLALLQGGWPDSHMAVVIGAKSPATWRARKNDPETLTLYEVRKLCEKSGVSVGRFVGEKLGVE